MSEWRRYPENKPKKLGIEYLVTVNLETPEPYTDITTTYKVITIGLFTESGWIEPGCFDCTSPFEYPVIAFSELPEPFENES